MKFLFAAALALASLNAQAFVTMPRSVTKVFEYSCQKRFFEGEGVQQNGISCVPYQHLGFYLANYSYYLFESSARNNFQNQGRTSFFPGSICGLPQLDRYNCESSPHIAFGLSEFPEGPFVARVQMTASPEGQVEPYGYVALPDRNTGECEPGLEKSFVHVARFGGFRAPLPTNFPINSDGSDNYVIRPDRSMGLPFELTRVPTYSPCDARGYCRWPDGRSEVVASAYLTPVGNAFCVIPANRLLK
jgi:hypothetical protein